MKKKFSMEHEKRKCGRDVTLFRHSPLSRAVRIAKSRSWDSSESASNMVICNSWKIGSHTFWELVKKCFQKVPTKCALQLMSWETWDLIFLITLAFYFTENFFNRVMENCEHSVGGKKNQEIHGISYMEYRKHLVTHYYTEFTKYSLEWRNSLSIPNDNEKNNHSFWRDTIGHPSAHLTLETKIFAC